MASYGGGGGRDVGRGKWRMSLGSGSSHISLSPDRYDARPTRPRNEKLRLACLGIVGLAAVVITTAAIMAVTLYGYADFAPRPMSKSDVRQWMARKHESPDRHLLDLDTSIVRHRANGLEQELHSWASTGYHPIPRTIHQLWKTTEIPEVHHSNVETWKAKNDGFAYKLWTDLEMNAHMKKHHPEFAIAWSLMKPIERADTFRYVVLYDFGGYYADMDVECLVPIDLWTANQDNYYNVDFIVGFEVVTDRTDWINWFARQYQLCQWTMGSAPGHPALRIVLDNIAHFFSKLPDTHTIMDSTGPGMWTDSIESYLRMQHGISFGKDRLTKQRMENNYIHVGSTLLMPIRSFAVNSAGYELRPEHSFDDMLVRHYFSGSWKPPEERMIDSNWWFGGPFGMGEQKNQNDEDTPKLTCIGLAIHRGQRICGYGVSPESELPTFAFDGLVDTKWLSLGEFRKHPASLDAPIPDSGPYISLGLCNPTSLEQRRPESECSTDHADAPISLSWYAVVSANDYPDRDPRDWVLEALPAGSSNTDGNWTVIDHQVGQEFASRFLSKNYTVAVPGLYSRFRFRVLGIHNADQGMVQISELVIPNLPMPPDPPGVPICTEHVCVCCGITPDKEGVANLYDDGINTKMLLRVGVQWPGAFVTNITLQKPTGTIVGYNMTSANDFPERDPAAWTVFGQSNNSDWIELDSRSDVVFNDRNSTFFFRLSPSARSISASITKFRLAIRRLNATKKDSMCTAASVCLQIADFRPVVAEFGELGIAPVTIHDIAAHVESQPENTQTTAVHRSVQSHREPTELKLKKTNKGVSSARRKHRTPSALDSHHNSNRKKFRPVQLVHVDSAASQHHNLPLSKHANTTKTHPKTALDTEHHHAKAKPRSKRRRDKRARQEDFSPRKRTNSTKTAHGKRHRVTAHPNSNEDNRATHEGAQADKPSAKRSKRVRRKSVRENSPAKRSRGKL